MKKTLQCDASTLTDTRALFDAVIESFPDTTNKITLSVDICQVAEVA